MRPFFGLKKMEGTLYIINRGYILPGCAEIWNFSSSVEIFFQHEKRHFISPSGHVIFYLLYKHQWTTIEPFHFNSFFGVKGATYYVAIAMVIFSHVKIAMLYFHMWRYQVCAQKLTWYIFIGLLYRCLYNKNIYAM